MNVANFNLNDWLFYLENKSQQEIERGLARISAVANSLDLLHWDVPVVTVTGTNGKGSTVASLEAIYVAAGYDVASYTSPHLMVFNERIRVNQQCITDEMLCAAFRVIEAARSHIPLSYFEMATLAALWYFRQCKLDVIILEVGIGGRLDATNIIDADLAIITTVDLDHQDCLGYTIDAIGYEKAGILRAKKIGIYADMNPPMTVLEQAQLLNTSMYCLDTDYSFRTTEDSLQLVLLTGEIAQLPLPKINVKAAAAAIIASTCLNPILPVSLLQLSEAMQHVQLPGRQQIIDNGIKTIFDVSHNPQAVSLLAEFIRDYRPKGAVHAVFSALKDKDLGGLIKPMLGCVDSWYLAVLSGQRAASESLLRAAFVAENCLVSSCYADPIKAYRAALQEAKQGDLIVVYGSFITVSAVMKVFERRELEEKLL